MRSSRPFFASLVTASASDHAVQPMLIFLSAAWAEPSVRVAARHEAAAKVRVLEKKPIVCKPPVFVFFSFSVRRVRTGRRWHQPVQECGHRPAGFAWGRRLRAEALGDAVEDDGEQDDAEAALETQPDVEPLDA